MHEFFCLYDFCAPFHFHLEWRKYCSYEANWVISIENVTMHACSSYILRCFKEGKGSVVKYTGVYWLVVNCATQRNIPKFVNCEIYEISC